MNDSLFSHGNDQSRNYVYREQNPHYHGEKFNPQLAQGPSTQRECRDCLCLILYGCFLAAMIVVGFFAFKDGNPLFLASPFDSAGFQCGVSAGYQDYSYGLYKHNDLLVFGCVKSCPNSTLAQIECLLNNAPCVGFDAYPTVRVVTMCYPTSGAPIDLGINLFQQSMHDLQASWPILLGTLFLSMFVSLLTVCLVQKCAACVVVTMIILKITALLTLGAVAFAASLNQIDLGFSDTTVLKSIAYVSWVLAALCLLIVICKCRQIRQAIAILKVAAEFTKDQPQTVAVPFIMYIIVGGFFVIWAIVSIYIMSSAKPTKCGPSPYACVDFNYNVQRTLILFLFGLFWNSQIAICTSQFVIASAAALWYWAHLDPSTKRRGYVCISFCRALTFHLGSIVFGALLLTIVHILQLMLEVFSASVKKHTLKENPMNACGLCCVQCARCCLSCFQRFIRFLSKNGLMMAAITGEGFCSASHQAFYLIMRSSSQYVVSHGLGHMVMWVCKIAVTVVCTLTAYLLLTNIPSIHSQLYTPLMPTLYCFVVSLVVAHFFMDVFGISADTLLLAYCLEKEIVSHTPACPPPLKAHLQLVQK